MALKPYANKCTKEKKKFPSQTCVPIFWFGN